MSGLGRSCCGGLIEHKPGCTWRSGAAVVPRGNVVVPREDADKLLSVVDNAIRNGWTDLGPLYDRLLAALLDGKDRG